MRQQKSPCWSEKEVLALQKANSFKKLFQVAPRLLKRLRRKNPKSEVGMVCGPINTGGGKRARNIVALKNYIDKLRCEGMIIFGQLPLIEALERILRSHPKQTEINLMLDFYDPLFHSRLINCLYFVPKWDTSYGTRWEHTSAEKYGLKKIYL